MNRPDEIDDVLEQLAALAPGETEQAPPAPQALARLQHTVKQNEQRFLWRRYPMSNQRKYALSTVLLVLAVVVAFSLPPVRAAASDFLGLFRVQKFAAISVSPQQLALLEQVAEQGLHPGELHIVENASPPVAVSSVAEAEAQMGEAVRTVPALGEAQGMMVAGGASGYLTIDVENAREIMRVVDVDPMLLPDSVDGERVDVTLFPSLMMTWTNGVELMQMQSPEVDYPEDVDPAVMGEALLQVLGLNQREARRLAQNIDWTSTLLLPIPTDMATFSEVAIDGTTGLYLESMDRQESSLMWQQQGVVYLLVDREGGNDLLDIAGSLN